MSLKKIFQSLGPNPTLTALPFLKKITITLVNGRAIKYYNKNKNKNRKIYKIKIRISNNIKEKGKMLTHKPERPQHNI